MSFFSELKRRSVFRVGLAYVLVSWLAIQFVDVFSSIMELPAWIGQAILLILVVGFVPALVFSWVYEVTPAGVKRDSEVDRDQSADGDVSRRLDLVVIILLLAVLLGMALNRFLPGQLAVPGPVGPRATTTSPQSVESGLSIAVLPFLNMSPDPAQEFFSDGISEELLNALARYPQLRVAARSSAFQFKGQQRDVKEIGRQLNVTYLLEGSVRKTAQRLRISAQLINAATGFHLWSDSWDRDAEDIFSIQDEIARSVGQALEVRLNLDKPMGDGLAVIPAASGAQAYELYLKGRQLINGRSREGLVEATMALEKAIALDPGYGPAHAQLAIAIGLLKEGAGSYGDLSLEEVKERAMPHIAKASELEPHLAEAHAARALLALNSHDYSSAARHAREAMSLNPSYMDPIAWLYLSLFHSSAWLEARKVIEHMMSVDPLSIVGQSNYAFALARIGDYPGARAVASGMLPQSPLSSYLAHGLISGDYTGELADSTFWYLKGIVIDADNYFARSRLAINLAAVGEYAEAERISPRSRWWVEMQARHWEEAIGAAQAQVGDHPGDPLMKLRLADILHVSGQVAQAQPLYESLLEGSEGRPLLNPGNTSILPTVRAAYGRLVLGDEAGSRSLRAVVTRDLESRREADINGHFLWSAAALVAAMDGDKAGIVKNFERAIGRGLRNLNVFLEPALEVYREDAGLLALQSRLEEILAMERQATLRLVCAENPAVEVWRPLPETCAGIESVAGGR